MKDQRDQILTNKQRITGRDIALIGANNPTVLYRERVQDWTDEKNAVVCAKLLSWEKVCLVTVIHLKNFKELEDFIKKKI